MFTNAKSEKISYVQSIVSSDIFKIALFSIITAVAAQIAIPVKPVPFTLQTLIVLLSGALLGSKKGAYAQLIYLGMGITGLPVFAQIPDGAIGFARLFGPTGGYLLAFPAAAFVTGYILENRKSLITAAAALLAGEMIIILSGTLYLFAFWLKDLNQAIAAGAALFTVWTVVKVIAGTAIYKSLSGNR